MAESSEVWARLVKLGSPDDQKDISGESFTIGRNPECDLAFVENKLVSQKHCTIKLEEDGNISLTDTSTNGTQIDGIKVKQSTHELNHGDEIHIVFRKTGTQSNIGYTFQQLSKTVNDSFEPTLEYDPIDFPNTHDNPDEPPRKQSRVDSEAAPSGAAVKSAQPAAEADDTDEIEETLLCSICQELLHDCVSLQPCMHTYCAGCFSQWMNTSKSCPTCRKKATSVAQNHILRNLIEIYLKTHPDKRRPKEDLDELDKKNVVKVPNMTLAGRASEYDDDDDDDYDSDGSRGDSDISDDGVPAAHIGARLPAVLTRNVPVCRQCPGYSEYRARLGQPTVPASDPAAPPFQCTADTQRHSVCFCCMEPFPVRNVDPAADPPLPKISCDVCSGTFCHLYWGCRKPNCRGCLNKLKDMNVDDTILLSNPTESQILKDYMRSESVTVQQLIQHTCTKLDAGDFQLNNDFNCNFAGRNLTGDSNFCHTCGLRALRQLAYHYRKNIDPNDLPAAVVNKEDCYWGKNCRTQGKPHHALKWNHICEQTRFTR